VKKLVAYLLLVILLYLVHRSMLLISTNFWYGIFTGLLLTGVFTYFIFRVERKEFKKLPWLGKYVM
jgi:Na+-driven multidrug efflux pump